MNMNYIEKFLDRNDSKNTKTAYKYNLVQMLEYIGKSENEIEYGDLIDYKEHFSKKYSTNSMAQKIRCIRSYFNYLYFELEVIDHNPATNMRGKNIKEDKIHQEKQRYYTMEEIKLLIANAKNDRDKAIIAVLTTTGIRASELINLTLEDYEKKIVVIITKGKVNREIMFNDFACEYVDKYLSTRKESEYNNLFISNQGTPMKDNCLNKTLKTNAKRAGLPTDIHMHSVRHTVVSNVLENYDLETARQFIGHASASTTLRYCHTTNNKVRNVAMSMGM